MVLLKYRTTDNGKIFNIRNQQVDSLNTSTTYRNVTGSHIVDFSEACTVGINLSLPLTLSNVVVVCEDPSKWPTCRHGLR